MKTYKNLYPKLFSYKNLELAFRKASKRKTKKPYVQKFRENLEENLSELKKELENETYKPSKLTKFIIRDPKTRVIRKSVFKDRIVHHAIVNILEPIYEPRFIPDTFANRLDKGTIPAIKRLDKFKRRVSKNGHLVSNSVDENMIKGYIFKADVKKFFDSVNQDKLIGILRRKIKDEKVIWLIIKILKNFDDKISGMPLGNMTSQFFANIYLNDLDQFVKRNLKMKYYLRYVDDFLILHKDKKILIVCRRKIELYLKNLKLELHPDKTKIYPLYQGIDFLGFKIFYHYKIVRKRNVGGFRSRLGWLKKQYIERGVTKEEFTECVEGWFAYACWADSYNLRKRFTSEIVDYFRGAILKPRNDLISEVQQSLF